MNDDQPDEFSPRKQRAVDVAIAEYNALRAEIVTKATIQYTFIGGGLTAIGVVVGFGFSGGQRAILLAVPFVSSITMIVYAALAAQILFLSRYVRQELWPYLQRACDPDLPSWPQWAKRRGVQVASTSTPGKAIGILFYLPGIAAVFVVPDLAPVVRVVLALLVTACAVAGVVMVQKERNQS